MDIKKWCMGLAGLLACCSAAFSDVQYISAARFVQATGTVWPVIAATQSQNDLQQSSVAGAFAQTALVNLTVSEIVPGYAGAAVPNWMTSYATATQSSSLSAQSITESGSLDYYTSQTYAGDGAASAESSLIVTFVTTNEMSFSLFFLDGMPAETATLTDVSTGQVWGASGSPLQGILTPGKYTLTHVLDYGQAYHDSSDPVNFGLEMSFRPIVAVPEPSAPLLLVIGSALMACRRRPARSESVRYQ